jgi:hypothetical protein
MLGRLAIALRDVATRRRSEHIGVESGRTAQYVFPQEGEPVGILRVEPRKARTTL